MRAMRLAVSGTHRVGKPKPRIATVAEYLAAQPPARRTVVAQVRAAIRTALPTATEGISYQMPVYKIDGVLVLYFAGYAKHLAIYPAYSETIEALGPAARRLLCHKATLRFPLTEKMPLRLIARFARLRAAEVSAGDRDARRGAGRSRQARS